MREAMPPPDDRFYFNLGYVQLNVATVEVGLATIAPDLDNR